VGRFKLLEEIEFLLTSAQFAIGFDDSILVGEQPFALCW
jgi:hypothetical protein